MGKPLSIIALTIQVCSINIYGDSSRYLPDDYWLPPSMDRVRQIMNKMGRKYYPPGYVPQRGINREILSNDAQNITVGILIRFDISNNKNVADFREVIKKKCYDMHHLPLNYYYVLKDAFGDTKYEDKTQTLKDANFGVSKTLTLEQVLFDDKNVYESVKESNDESVNESGDESGKESNDKSVESVDAQNIRVGIVIEFGISNKVTVGDLIKETMSKFLNMYSNFSNYVLKDVFDGTKYTDDTKTLEEAKIMEHHQLTLEQKENKKV